MKIFSQPDTTSASRDTKTKKHSAIKSAPSGKKEISDREIREKLAAHVETSNAAKSKILMQNSKQLGAGFMNEDIKPLPVVAEKKESEEKIDEVNDTSKNSHLLKSDVNLNDPKDPTTQEKLKSILSKGAFNFNPREREALDKILNGNN